MHQGVGRAREGDMGDPVAALGEEEQVTGTVLPGRHGFPDRGLLRGIAGTAAIDLCRGWLVGERA